MTKHNIAMVTRNTPHLVIVIFSDEVVKIKFLLCLDRYLFSVVSVWVVAIDTRGSNKNVLSITITWNVAMSR